MNGILKKLKLISGTIFRDPQAISIVDQEHSENEDRWITIGFDSSGVLLVVIHTFNYVSQEVCKIRN
ncbi:BrnT family toxin [Candidatus Marithrix sp. Canyon 246]|uniref:BrnT family toxin n=1 Tax=Candidatus Marithrix sp. Canyon 246 TaxID=1827136 RepID=UPI001C0CECFD|nr:BrnT family toxin [Candidatus Marithrix sp. Canyon 246]